MGVVEGYHLTTTAGGHPLHLIRLTNGFVIGLQEGHDELDICSMETELTDSEIDYYVCTIQPGGVKGLSTAGTGPDDIVNGLTGEMPQLPAEIREYMELGERTRQIDVEDDDAVSEQGPP